MQGCLVVRMVSGHGRDSSPANLVTNLGVNCFMARKKSKKIRTSFRKNRSERTRPGDLTRRFETDGLSEDSPHGERVTGKGDLTRHRTVLGEEVDDESGLGVRIEVDEASCLAGRVLSVHGLLSLVEAADGRRYNCATRRLLKSLTTDQRHVVCAGDRVLIRTVDTTEDPGEGIIERVEPRRGTLRRASKRRQHIIVTNVDQLLIVASAADPYLKPNLIDRFLISGEQARIEPIICINKVDLIDIASLQPLVGVYGQLGYQVILLSAETGFGIDRLRLHMRGRASVVAGQSGVGKSSLLNVIDPHIDQRVSAVSSENQKGRHTTTTARLMPLAFGGYVVDTPGIRQFQLWDVISEEIPGYFRDFTPFVSQCRFPNCTHTHEVECSVKDAVADGYIDARRYESYCHLLSGIEE